MTYQDGPDATSRWRTLAGLMRFSMRHPSLGRDLVLIRRRRLSMLSAMALRDLALAVHEIESADVPGAIVEAGTALGGSAVMLGRAKHRARPLFLFDAFGMIPAPSERDGEDAHMRYREIAGGEASGIAGDVYYGYRKDLIGQVREALGDFGLSGSSDAITLVPGLYEDTLRIDMPVALAHIDCDWHDSVITCLAAIEPHLQIGGRFVIDDYAAWAGCRAAVDAFFADRAGYRFEMQSRLHIIREA